MADAEAATDCLIRLTPPEPILLDFMDDLDYTTIIEFAEPLARPSRRSLGAKGDRRGSLGHTTLS